MTDTLAIAGRPIGPDHPPYIIAELSGNHDGSLDRAKQIIDAMAAAGADAVKLQTYTADLLTLDSDKDDFLISDPASPWHGRRLHELYQQAYTPWEWHAELFAHAKAVGIPIFSSPFDPTAVDFLEELGCPAYKIASFENNFPALIQAAARTGKPLIISTGASDAKMVLDAVATARAAGCASPVVLKCTSSYPADASQTDLRSIPHMRDLLGCPIGLSDHTLGIGVAVASVALGAVVIEKHVTLSADDTGVDASFSLTPEGLAQLVTETRRAWAAMGGVNYDNLKGSEFKRSLYFSRDLAKGAVVAAGDIRIVRPGYGLPPSELPRLLGRRLTRAVTLGDRVTDDVFQI